MNELKQNKDLSIPDWAKAVLALANLVFLVLDTTGIDNKADIIRVLVINAVGETLFHSIIKPERHYQEANTTYTGIQVSDLDAAPTLPLIWPDLHTVLHGKYVLVYSWEFVHFRLRENAAYYRLVPITFAGECLQETTSTYFGTATSLKSACERIGHQLPERPMAIERAQAQLALLKAMAMEVGAPKRFDEELTEEELHSLDDQPF